MFPERYAEQHVWRYFTRERIGKCSSLLLLLVLTTVSQGYTPTYRFRYLKAGGAIPRVTYKPRTPSPKSGPATEEAFILPTVPAGSLMPQVVPHLVTGPMPFPLMIPVTRRPTAYAYNPPGPVIATLATIPPEEIPKLPTGVEVPTALVIPRIPLPPGYRLYG
ncbi:hypothetical protein HPB50_012181 [Hyalomma asiaticum]|uniref:Uncharacterized protein n=1 Tax=Hyalomma asiaticum TaxID=266040 RepID=A0ACB7SGB4_HYAAI|nr:hypothetical protein HPB50_012181 [Hyalomma asiaticum]